MGLMEIPSELSVSPLKGSGGSCLIRPRNGAFCFLGNKKAPRWNQHRGAFLDQSGSLKPENVKCP